MAASTEEQWQWLWSHRNWLVAIARSDFRNVIHGDKNKAFDLVDDVLLRAARNIDDLRDRRSVKPWLRTILKYAALDLAEGTQAEGQGFAQWLRAANEAQEGNDSYRYFAFLSLLELKATKAEKRYIASFKKDAATRRVVNIPKNRAVQLLKKRLHAKGADYATAQIKLAHRGSQNMVGVDAFAKQITANIAALFKKRFRGIVVPDDVVWEWCCALVVAEMRAGLAEAKTHKSVSREVAKVVDDIFKFALKSVMLDAAVQSTKPPNNAY